MLQEAVEARNDPARGVVCPNPRPGPVIRIFGQQMRRVMREGFFKELAEHRALVQRLSLVLKCGHETAWV